MSLIKCPICGRDVSNKANICPSCGVILHAFNPYKSPTFACEDCGEVYSVGLLLCPKCGCPKTNPVFHKKKRKTVIIVLTMLVLLSLVGLSTIVIQKVAEHHEQELVEQHEQELINYMSKLKKATKKAYNNAILAEDAANLVQNVWYDSIYQYDNSNTAKYIKDSNGIYYEDFNHALSSLYSDDKYQQDINSIEKEDTQVSKYLRDLKNPPDEYKEVYAVFKDFYDAYSNLVQMATYPTGSLNSYTTNFNETDTNVSKYYRLLEAYLD